MPKLKTDDAQLADRIDAILPQTQCGKCGYSGCRPYAAAIAGGEADINLCPPGGEEGIRELAELLGVGFKPFGEDVVLRPPSVAFIDENLCIGCTLCLQACPVDAISGASKQMHTIIAALCTGCELCVPPCPVDCIGMLPLPQETPSREKKRAAANAARERYRFRLERTERDKRERAERLAQKERAAAKPVAAPETDAQALIRAALERAREQAAAVKPRNTGQLTPAQQAQIEEIEARRARAHELARPGATPPEE
ncbi:MAG: electron transport complex subunit RsxB [Nitrosomonadales bacterium]|nr:electron transport complex subunit RsxB [Nitrosomonadales bacterium]